MAISHIDGSDHTDGGDQSHWRPHVTYWLPLPRRGCSGTVDAVLMAPAANSLVTATLRWVAYREQRDCVVDMRPVGRERVITFGNKVCRSGALGAIRARRYAVHHDGSVW